MPSAAAHRSSCFSKLRGAALGGPRWFCPGNALALQSSSPYLEFIPLCQLSLLLTGHNLEPKAPSSGAVLGPGSTIPQQPRHFPSLPGKGGCAHKTGRLVSGDQSVCWLLRMIARGSERPACHQQGAGIPAAPAQPCYFCCKMGGLNKSDTS